MMTPHQKQTRRLAIRQASFRRIGSVLLPSRDREGADTAPPRCSRAARSIRRTSCDHAPGGCIHRGFSLAELVLVLAIIGVLSAIAIPRLSNSIALQRVEAAARRIVVDLAFAQRLAKSSNVAQTVRFDMATHKYVIVGMPHPDDPTRDYGVALREEPYGATLVSVNLNNGNGNEIIFDVFGVPDGGGSIVISVGSRVRTISVDADTGKASVQ